MDGLNIGLSFSGGGYRAAVFHLGALSFLNSINVGDGKTLLEHVSVLSTVSGGTITGLKYMLSLAKKQDINDMVDELYAFLYNENLFEDFFANLEKGRTEDGMSFIKLMANIYDNKLFNNSVMGDLMDCVKNGPVERFSANATDFGNGLPFRFQVKSGLMVANDDRRNLKREDLLKITLGEALACSSCFPGAFEPMMFPDDFKVGSNGVMDKKDRFGIMDGGIVDNQGIEVIELAEESMRKKGKAFDLVIVSDVSSPYMDAYSPNKQMLPKSIGKWTLGNIQKGVRWTGALTTLLWIASILAGNHYLIGAMTVVWGLTAAVNLIMARSKKKLVKLLSKTIVGNITPWLKHLSLADIESLLMNRATSVLMMTSSVFLKRIRKMSYSSLHDDEEWHNRLITNTIYELRPEEKWAFMRKNNNLPEYLAPSPAMQENSRKAANMKTTLWFTQEDKDNGYPEAVFAAGRYTICYNLLKYIEDIQKDGDNTNENHELIISCKQQLMEAWAKFQENPLEGAI